MKVLFVDDDADLRRIGRLSLTAISRWTVLEAASGALAIELARRERPDVILLDVMMPQLNGVTAFEKLQAGQGTARIPVIFITAKTQRHEVEEYLAMGAAGVISKPFDPLSLSRQILEAVATWGVQKRGKPWAKT